MSRQQRRVACQGVGFEGIREAVLRKILEPFSEKGELERDLSFLFVQREEGKEGSGGKVP